MKSYPVLLKKPNDPALTRGGKSQRISPDTEHRRVQRLVRRLALLPFLCAYQEIPDSLDGRVREPSTARRFDRLTSPRVGCDLAKPCKHPLTKCLVKITHGHGDDVGLAEAITSLIKVGCKGGSPSVVENRGRCVRGCIIALSPSSLFFQSCNRPGDAGRGHSNVPRYLCHR